MKRAIVRLGLDEQGRHVAVCQTASWCHWSYANVVKTDVQQHAKWHRDEHRRCRQLAEASTRYGHFRKPNQSSAWVPCPVCRHHVSTSFVAWATTREIERLLHDAVEAHLHDRDECKGGRR